MACGDHEQARSVIEEVTEPADHISRVLIANCINVIDRLDAEQSRHTARYHPELVNR
jgi:hypothetical protein